MINSYVMWSFGSSFSSDFGSGFGFGSSADAILSSASSSVSIRKCLGLVKEEPARSTTKNNLRVIILGRTGTK